MGATTMTYTCIIMKLRTTTVSSVELNQKMAIKDFTQLSKTHPDRKSTRLNSSHMSESRMPSSA